MRFRSTTAAVLAAVTMSAGAVAASGFAAGEAGAASWSYRGGLHVTGCSGSYGRWGAFSADTDQWVDVRTGKVHGERHEFSMSGFLEGFESAGRIRIEKNFVIYRNGSRDLAVPFRTGNWPHVRYNLSDGSNKWVRLCGPGRGVDGFVGEDEGVDTLPE